MYLQHSIKTLLSSFPLLSYKIISPREKSFCNSTRRGTIDGIIIKSENGVIIKSGSNNPVKMYDPKVFIIIRVAGMKLYVKTPEVPIKAASQAIFGKVG